MTGDYTIREYRPEDRNELLSLHRETFGRPAFDEEWFAWKYENNPYTDSVPIVIAEHAGSIVGVRAFFAMAMCAGGDVRLALQPCDTMVQEDHRGRGLFTRMTEYAIERYTDDEPAFFFNFPNEKSGPGNLKLGWRTVGLPTHIRIQRPVAILAEKQLPRPVRIAGSIAEGAMGAYFGIRGRLLDVPDDVTVERYESTPASLLASLHERRVPNEIHAIRDEEFYEWRTANPVCRFETYVAFGDGEPRAALVAKAHPGGSLTKLHIADFLPLNPTPTDQPFANRLLRELLDEWSHADLVLNRSTILPPKWLASHGFLNTDFLPGYESGPEFVVRSLDPAGSWQFGDLSLTDPESWRIADIERDT